MIELQSMRARYELVFKRDDARKGSGENYVDSLFSI